LAVKAIQRKLPKPFWSNPEWEAMKGRCRNLPHHVAVAECAFLSDQYRAMWRRSAPVTVQLNPILETLLAKKIPFVLTGAYGISSWTGRPRATHDVDILVKAGRNHARAVSALKDLYPDLEVRHLTGLTAFFEPGEFESVIDVSCPQRPDNEETLRTAIWVEDHGLKFRIPSLEAALANKYGAMLALGRDVGKRTLDTVDFYFMVKNASNPARKAIDLEKIVFLGEKVWPGGGGQELLGLVEKAKGGETPDLKALFGLGKAQA
jgi:hypothetical protein